MDFAESFGDRCILIRSTAFPVSSLNAASLFGRREFFDEDRIKNFVKLSRKVVQQSISVTMETVSLFSF